MTKKIDGLIEALQTHSFTGNSINLSFMDVNDDDMDQLLYELEQSGIAIQIISFIATSVDITRLDLRELHSLQELHLDMVFFKSPPLISPLAALRIVKLGTADFLPKFNTNLLEEFCCVDTAFGNDDKNRVLIIKEQVRERMLKKKQEAAHSLVQQTEGSAVVHAARRPIENQWQLALWYGKTTISDQPPEPAPDAEFIMVEQPVEPDEVKESSMGCVIT